MNGYISLNAHRLDLLQIPRHDISENQPIG